MVTKCRYVPVVAKAKNRHLFPSKDAPPSSADTPPVSDEPMVRIASEPSDDQSNQNSRLESWLKKAQDSNLTRTDSIHLANLLNGSKSWPMDKVGVHHLLAEMRAGASAMTRMVLLVRAKDTQLHSLAKLADEIIRHKQGVLVSAELLFAVSEFSQFLGIVRPFRSNNLNQLAQSHLLTHPELILPAGLKNSLGEAEKWTLVRIEQFDRTHFLEQSTTEPRNDMELGRSRCSSSFALCIQLSSQRLNSRSTTLPGGSSRFLVGYNGKNLLEASRTRRHRAIKSASLEKTPIEVLVL